MPARHGGDSSPLCDKHIRGVVAEARWPAKLRGGAGVVFGLYGDNGKESEKYYNGLYRVKSAEGLCPGSFGDTLHACAISSQTARMLHAVTVELARGHRERTSKH